MAGRERKLTIILAGDDRGASKAIGNLEHKTGGLASKLGGLAKGAAIGFGAITAGAVVLGKGLVDAATESAKVTAQTTAVLKSMGNVAGVTANQVAGLSEQLSLKSGVDDEVIQSAQNVLLTFGNVRNEIGKGNKVFDRATAAALDMSVALGTDMQSATLQVGKALQDPIKGITALSRAGVSFSQEQKNTIKRLVETGDTLGAQKIILSELDKQFGGSAEAQATAADKLNVAWGNVQEQLGEKLLPVVEKVATFLAKSLPRAVEAAERVFGPLAKKISEFWNALTTGFTEDEGTPIELFALKVRDALQDLAAFIEKWWPKIVDGFGHVVEFVRDHWPEIQRIVGQVLTTVQTIIAGAVSIITTLWENFGNNILEFVQRVWPNIQQVIDGALTIIRGIVKTITSLIKGDWSGVWEGLRGIVSGAWQGIQGVVKAAFEALRGIVGLGLEIVGSIFKGAWNGLVGWFWSIPTKVSDIAKRIWEGLKNGLAAAIRWIKNQLDKLLGPLDEIVGKVGGVVGKIGGGIGSALGSLPGLASGGPVVAGRPYLVGERGPELFVSGRSGTIIPNSAMGSGGGNTYQITLVVPPTADLAAVGKATIEAISAYEDRNGRAWRAS